MKFEKPRLEQLKEFDNAPLSALFPQETVCAIRNCSTATVERDRWAGTGIPFIKMGRSVRYRKADVLAWLEQYQSYRSTSEIHSTAEGK